MTTTTVYISIGNSDDKLTQAAWAQMIWDVNYAISNAPGARLHGDWYASPVCPYQNACWCIELNEEMHPGTIGNLREELRFIADQYAQRSIAWGAVAEMEFLGSEVPA